MYFFVNNDYDLGLNFNHYIHIKEINFFEMKDKIYN